MGWTSPINKINLHAHTCRFTLFHSVQEGSLESKEQRAKEERNLDNMHSHTVLSLKPHKIILEVISLELSGKRCLEERNREDSVEEIRRISSETYAELERQSGEEKEKGGGYKNTSRVYVRFNNKQKSDGRWPFSSQYFTSASLV